MVEAQKLDRIFVGADGFIREDKVNETVADLQRNLRHWREECGKLHAQVQIAKDQRNTYQKQAQDAQREIAKLKGDLLAWEITAKRIAEADFLDFSLAPERSAAAIARSALQTPALSSKDGTGGAA